MATAIRTERSFELPYPVAVLWPILGKTDWLNRSIGLPPVAYKVEPLPAGGSRVQANASLVGIPLTWEEKPFEWVENDFYHVQRVFAGGPLAEAKMGMVFRPRGPRATEVVVFSEFTPRNWLGALLARTLIAPKGDRDMAVVIRHVEAHLAGHTPVILPRLPASPVNDAALQAGLAKVAGAGISSSLVLRLEQMLREAPDVALAHVRPYQIAREWSADRWQVLRLFLHATRAGLLDFSWEVLCPNCRSSRQPPAGSLAELAKSMHCDVCQINYDGEFDKSVELKFRASPALRAVDFRSFCLAGPGGKPHVVSQILLAPGQRRV
jgi:hypothetical protein